MQDIETWNIAGGILEYIDDIHTYLFNGEILPSITQILKIKFGDKYKNVDENVLKRASEKGTRVHKAIEDYEKHNIEDISCSELRDWKFLKKAYKFECLDNEVPIVLFKDYKPVACGRLDLVLEEDEKIGIGDIKTTSTLDKEYLAYQLNLYRIGFQQCYEKNIEFLRGVHLKNGIRKYVEIPIREEMAWDLINEYLEREKERNDDLSII